MKTKFKTLFVCLFYFVNANAQELNGVTFGLGAGYSILRHNIYDYSLTSDSIHALQQQQLSKATFVISSIITIKLESFLLKTIN